MHLRVELGIKMMCKFHWLSKYDMTNCIFSGERDVMMKQLREQVSEKENEVHRLGKFPSNLAII